MQAALISVLAQLAHTITQNEHVDRSSTVFNALRDDEVIVEAETKFGTDIIIQIEAFIHEDRSIIFQIPQSICTEVLPINLYDI